MGKIIKRLPTQKKLSEIIPSGAEGGKEFARIVDLLLFHHARREGKNLTLFDDRSGDWCGLDSFAGEGHMGEVRVGYQYKFFPSNLTAKHRSEIKKSLEKSLEGWEKSKITKWILVTPDDLVESAKKKGGGDVSWFTDLKKSL